ELDDLLVRARPLLLAGEPLDPFDEHPAVPGPVEHGHAAPTRQRGPEAPEEVVSLGVGRRRRELSHAYVPGVEAGHQPLDRPALARSVPTLEQDAERRS